MSREVDDFQPRKQLQALFKRKEPGDQDIDELCRFIRVIFIFLLLRLLSRVLIGILIFFYYAIFSLPLCHVNDTWADVEYHWQVLAGIVEQECPNLALKRQFCLFLQNNAMNLPHFRYKSYLWFFYLEIIIYILKKYRLSKI